MRYLKHQENNKHLFIDSRLVWFETFEFNLKHNKIKSDYEFSEKDDKKEVAKKLDVYIEKYKKKGFEELAIPQQAIDKANAFCEKIELGKVYYFHLEEGKPLMKEKLTVVKVEGGRVYKFISEDDASFPTIIDYSAGAILMANEKTEDHEVLDTLKPILWMYFTLGFEPIEEQTILEKMAGKPLNLEQEYPAKFQLSEYSFGKFARKDNFFEKDLLLIATSYVITNEKIVSVTKGYNVFRTLKEFQQNQKSYEEYVQKEDPKLIFIPEAELFDRYPLEITPIKYFEQPEKIKITAPKFQIKVPQGAIDIPIKGFYAGLVDVNRLYFYVKEEGDNPLEWKAGFIVVKDLARMIYLATKVFKLKDFNKIYASTDESEPLKYSSDLEAFFNAVAKSYKKAKLTPYPTEKIIALLSKTSLSDLNHQKPLEEFSLQGDYFKELVECYENYANVWIAGNDKRHYLQFFPDKAARTAWLKNKRTGEQVAFYPKEVNYIDNFVQYVQKEEKSFPLKFALSNYNAALKAKLRSETARKKFFKSEFEVMEGDWEVDGDLVISRHQSLVVKGNLKVNGTLLFTALPNASYSNYPFLIIEGNVTTQNMLMNGGFEYLAVNGDFIVENMAACSYSKKHTALHIEGLAKTDILLHQQMSVSMFQPYFDFTKEVNPFSDAILEPTIFRKDTYGSMRIEHQVIFDLLKEGKQILADNIEESKVDLDEYYKLQFERRMKDWGQFYPEYAGCEALGISEDNEIKGNSIYPGSGDWVVNDLRGKSGTYGVNHEDYSICKLKVKKPAEFGIDYKQKPVKRIVSVEELMNRYIQISMLYMNWAHRKTVAFNIENTDATFQKEKAVFKEDPHLALYWLNHFGATLDQRYFEVVQLIEKHNLVEQLDILKEPLAFFKKTDVFYDLKIDNSYGDKKEFEELFLKRRSYLVYYEQVYKNYNPENLDLWWKSITIYPKVEENLIVRMRWLRNNLKKCNNWTDFDQLIKKEDQNIPLLSYVLCCNPSTSDKDKTQYADTLVRELFEHRNHFKTPHKKQFAEIILWDIRAFVSTKEKLQETAKFHFKGNETSQEFQDIQTVLGIQNENLAEVKAALEKLTNAFAGYDRFDTPSDEKPRYHQKVRSILDELAPEILIETAHNIQNRELAKRYFVYLWHAAIQNKKDALVRLFIYIELSGHNVSKELFGDRFSTLVKNDDDPNLEIAKAFLAIPEADFRNDSMWKNSKQAATKFFLSSAHYPKIFNFLIKTVKQAPTKENRYIIDAIYTTLFSQEYDSKINPVLKFSKEQIETMLTTICDWFLNYSYHSEGYRSIYYCANPLAEDWIKEHMNDKKWLKKFAHISTHYDPLNEELKDAFESALEFIESEKYNAYLEFKDEKSHKFWEISFYEEAFIVKYGKVGSNGKESEKKFETTEECFREGKKLIAQKLKKGYVKTAKQ